ncbi:MAG: DUF488 domain-containing protein [Acidimicrobiales bacterium]|nr:DUF488 domain-containing protein [Acidimicrobiales bacterium]
MVNDEGGDPPCWAHVVDSSFSDESEHAPSHTSSHTPTPRIKRIYESASDTDGRRILVDRLWPRGVSKAEALLDEWFRDVAPSNDLRHWFGHDPAKWDEFCSRYRSELADNKALNSLVEECMKGTTTLLFAAHDVEHNNAVVLRDVLSELIGLET